MYPASRLKLIIHTLFLAALSSLLCIIALGVYAHGARYARFANEPYATTEARSYSGRYSRQRQSWETDLVFNTATGQTLRLRGERISAGEKTLLEAGHPVRRHYLLAAPHIIKPLGRAASAQAETTLALILAACALFTLGWLVYSVKQRLHLQKAT
ncbi:hypothetical protein H9Q10_02630 [Eikenella sp. S3360]|uniref:DUF3592 domain-containing protein n=1 Tax=Eikenella glucosivorans TaxID=2766967 RepID=A0ABS0N8C6_9NEIS|nr:hypothetical protein [Eikenella glucosivorans]MBH5328566.1 hypothetical protein [Eikenella glucosivorans]